MIKKICYSILLIILIAACKPAIDKDIISEDKTPQLIIQNVNIFNGRDSVLLKNKDVLISGGLIQKISNSIKDTAGIKVVNGTGKTLMPGMIDAHVHLSGSGSVPWDNYKANKNYNLAAYLYVGVTTVYDLGGLANKMSALSKDVDDGKVTGPSIYNTHIPITVKNSHPIPLTQIMLPSAMKGMVNKISPLINDTAEARSIISKYLKNDIDYVKISCDQIPSGTPEMSFIQMRSLIREAHKAGKKVFVHIGSPRNAIDAINAGADILAHGIWRGKLSPEQADTIAQSGIPIIYTIAGFHNVSHIHQGEFTPTQLDKNLVSDKILNPVAGEKGKEVHDHEVINRFFQDTYENSQYWKENFKLLHDRKALIVVGTDSNLPGTYAGATYIQELHLLKEYGLSNFEILSGATYFNSKLFLSNPDFGIIQEGKKANLLLINGNPLKELQLVNQPELILNNGNIITKKIN